jgi:hypothetical protein
MIESSFWHLTEKPDFEMVVTMRGAKKNETEGGVTISNDKKNLGCVT